MILIDLNQITIVRLYAIKNQRRNESVDMYSNPMIRKALSRDIFDFINKVHEDFGHLYGDVIMCADCLGPSWRKEVFPHYKASRKKYDNEETKRSKEFVKDFLNEFWLNYRNGPCYVYRLDRVEADEIIGHLVLTNPDERHMIVSRDKDFFQLHSDMVVSYDYINDKIIRKDGEKCLREHIICGDSGDGIPNILSDLDTMVTEGKRQKSMTKKRLSKFMNEIPDDLMVRYKQNRMLISFKHIPDEIKSIIVGAIHG